MGQWRRALTDLAKDPGSVPGTHMVAYNCQGSVPQCPVLPPDLIENKSKVNRIMCRRGLHTLLYFFQDSLQRLLSSLSLLVPLCPALGGSASVWEFHNNSSARMTSPSEQPRKKKPIGFLFGASFCFPDPLTQWFLCLQLVGPLPGR